MRRILVVITTAYIPTGGLASVMMNYYRNIDRSGLKIDFASTNDAPKVLTDELSANESRYLQLPPRKNVLAYFNALKKVCKVYDVIHVNGNSATAAIELVSAWMAGVKVRIAHNHTTKTEHPIIHGLLLPIFRKSYTCGLACSENAGNWLFGEGNFCVLQNAIDVERYKFSALSRNKIRGEFGIPKDAFVVGHVGKYYQAKNHDWLLEVFYEYQRHHDNCYLLSVGYGGLREHLEQKIEQLGLTRKVILTGERTDIPEMLSSMDIFIFPSIYEGLGMAVIEAQASGLPCLLSDRVPQDVYLTDYVASLPLSESARVWARKIDEMIVIDREEQCELNAMSIAKGGYNIKVEANELLKIYNS